MKYPEEIEQFRATAEALTALMRVALRDETARVEYDAAEDALVHHSGIRNLNRRVSTAGTSCAAAVRDFIDKVCRPF